MLDLTTRVDILSLLGRDTALKRVASTDGGEYSGSCPFCGGRDRFRVWPNAEKPRYWCRLCNKRGDGVQYLRDHDGRSFRDAVAQLGLASSLPERRPTPTPAPTEQGPPGPAWQEAAKAFITYAEEHLWAASGEGARVYLRQRRGLTDVTLKRWHLGYNPSDMYRPPGRWGLDGKQVWLAKGIVIPCQVGGRIWYIKTRRPLPGDDLAAAIGPGSSVDAKYVLVRGSHPALYGADDLVDHSAVVLVEGEFDAMLLSQHVGDLAAVATMGSASATLTSRWRWELRHARQIFACYDTDSAGRAGALTLAELSARVRIARPVGGKDLTDAWRAGADLGAWLRFHLAMHAPAPTPTTPTCPDCNVAYTEFIASDGHVWWRCVKCHEFADRDDGATRQEESGTWVV